MALEHFPEKSNLIADAENELYFLDRGVGDDFVQDMNRVMYSDGLFPRRLDSFQVTTNGGMDIRIALGICFIDGMTVSDKENDIFTIKASSPTTQRDDLIVLQYNRQDRMFYYKIKENTTLLTRNSEIYEVGLARIRIPRNLTQLTSANITDLRLDSSYLGIVTPLYDIDINGVKDQFQQYFDELVDKFNEDLAVWQAYLESIKNMFDTDYKNILEIMNNVATGSFVLINHDFDDWFTKKGCVRTTIFNADGSIYEDYTVKESGFVLATRNTKFTTNKVEEIVTFKTFEIIIENTTIQSLNYNATKSTVFNANGSIAEDIV